MTGTRRLIAVAIAVAWCAVDASGAVCAEPQATAEKPGLCELPIQGHSILSLTLLKDAGPSGYSAGKLTGQRHVRPGTSLWLPAGRYRVNGRRA